MAAEAADPSRSGADGAAGAGGVIGDWGGGGAGCAALLCSRSCIIGAAGTNAGRCVLLHPTSYIQPPHPTSRLLCCKVGFEEVKGTPSAAQWG